VKRRLASLAALAVRLACGALVAGASGTARAELPDAWAIAREPRLLATQRAVDTAYEMALDASSPPGRERSPEGRQLLFGARSLLETAGAINHPDPTVRFFYGEVLANLSDDAGTVAALEPAVAAFPDHPDALQAYYYLAIAYARTNRREDEVRAYDRYLDRQTLPSLRALALYNHGDALMSLGDLPRATANFRSAIELEPGQSSTGLLARWGLAVALDRAGDIAQAIVTAKEAVQLDAPGHSVLRNESTFFVPEYDIFWYEALRHWAFADLAAGDVSERRRNLELSSLRWQTFIASAPSTDPWVGLAQARFRRTQHLLTKLAGSGARLRPAPPSPALPFPTSLFAPRPLAPRPLPPPRPFPYSRPSRPTPAPPPSPAPRPTPPPQPIY
jgi:tetratricopeptide (TPR) repeat protein